MVRLSEKLQNDLSHSAVMGLENIRPIYQVLIARGITTAVEMTKFRHDPGTLALSFVLSQAQALRPVYGSESLNADSPLYTDMGGDDFNPHRAIDTVGGELIKIIAGMLNFPVRLHVEEDHKWLSVNDDKEGDPIFMLVDPIDGTNSKGMQTTGIIIADKNFRLLAGAVASLVDSRVALFENGKVRMWDFDHESLTLKEHQPKQERKDKPPFLRLATLPRRMEKLSGTRLFQTIGGSSLMTIGGYGLLEMLDGKVDAMVDPLKGQKWEEVCIWQNLLQFIGMPVTYPDGTKIDFPVILRQAFFENKAPRTKVIASANASFHQQVLNSLSAPPLGF